MRSSEPFPHFVDDYLAYLHEAYPTQATLDGIHRHDDLLEDLSRSAIEAQVRALAGFLRRLEEIDKSGLTAIERIERPLLADNIRARMHDLEDVRAWQKNPAFYANVIATSLASQTVFAYAPAEERARRLLSRLRQVPRVVEAARANLTDVAGIFVKVGLETCRGTVTFIDRDLPRAFASIDDLHLLGDLADASTEASAAIISFIAYLDQELAPRARGSFRLGRAAFEQKLQLEEGLSIDADRLLTIVLRELAATQEAFRQAAGRVKKGENPATVWQLAQQAHPGPGELISTAQAQLDELRSFLDRHQIATHSTEMAVRAAPAPPFLQWTLTSSWIPGPFEGRPCAAYYYLSDVLRDWTPERQEEHLREFNLPTLWATSIREGYPGHVLHADQLRRVESKARQSRLLAPASFVDGWAHYAEQMMVEAGFRRKDEVVTLGQLAEALLRLGRAVVSIRLHAEDMSVEQGVRVLREECFLEESGARREAERGTFDPGYLSHALGKLMVLKLRRDYEESLTAKDVKFSLKDFHDTLLGQGTATVAAHRRLMLDGDPRGAALE